MIIRKIIREAIREAAYKSQQLPPSALLFFRDMNPAQYLVLYDAVNNEILGMITFVKRDEYFMVTAVASESGFGPLMYEFAMMKTSPLPIIAERNGLIKDKSANIWKFFLKNREDVKKTPIKPGSDAFRNKGEVSKEHIDFINFYFSKSPDSDFKGLINRSKEFSKVAGNKIIDKIFKRADRYFEYKYLYENY